MRHLLLAALGFATACRRQPEPTTPPVATPQECREAADHLVGLMTQKMNADEIPTETADKIRNVLDDRCVTDKWSPDAQQCFVKLVALEQSDQCAGFLTIDQRDAVDRAMDGAFAAPDNR